MQYCSLQHGTFTTRHIHNWVSFLLWPSCFILSGAIINGPLLFLSSILDTSWLGRFIFWCYIFLSCYTIHEFLQARVLEWVAVSSSSGPHFVRSLHFDLCVFCGPTRHGSQLHWVIQTPSPCQCYDLWKQKYLVVWKVIGAMLVVRWGLF